MKWYINPKRLQSDAIILGSSVYFMNVSAQMKVFIDRTSYLMDLFNNKIGAAIIVSCRYNLEGTISAFNFFQANMIVNRVVSGIGFIKG